MIGKSNTPAVIPRRGQSMKLVNNFGFRNSMTFKTPSKHSKEIKMKKAGSSSDDSLSSDTDTDPFASFQGKESKSPTPDKLVSPKGINNDKLTKSMRK